MEDRDKQRDRSTGERVRKIVEKKNKQRKELVQRNNLGRKLCAPLSLLSLKRKERGSEGERNRQTDGRRKMQKKGLERKK